MFDLRKNPFHLLGVLPQATAAEIIDAREDAEADGIAPEQELRMAAGALSHPRKRLTCEMSSLWGVPKKIASALLMRVSDNGEFDIADENLPPLARANLAAHVCASDMLSADDDRCQVIEWLIEARESIVESVLQDEFSKARKQAGIPSVKDEHLRESVRDLRQAHLDAALNAIEKATDPGKLMTSIVEEWLYAKTPEKIFILDMVGCYDRWSVPILRPIEEGIRKAASDWAKNPNEIGAATKIKNGIGEWSKYGLPIQLTDEAKGLDGRKFQAIGLVLKRVAVQVARNSRTKQTLDMLRDIVKVLDKNRHTKTALDLANSIPQLAAMPSVSVLRWNDAVRKYTRAEKLEDWAQAAEWADKMTEFASDAKTKAKARRKAAELRAKNQ